MSPTGRRRRDERGSALVELVWLGILLLVPLLWIVVSAFDVQRGAFGVESAARREVLMMVPVVFLVLPVTILFAFWPGVVGLDLTTP